MNTDTVLNWKKKISLKIQNYAREIFNLNDLSKNLFYSADAIESNCYEKLANMLNKLFADNFNEEAREFITTYEKYNHHSLREIGEDAAFKMLEDFEKIYSNWGGKTF